MSENQKHFQEHKKLEEKGDPKGTFELGCDYYAGDGCEKDIQKAKFYYKKAADLGFVDAQMAYALLHLEEINEPESPIEAFRYMSKACEQNNSTAHFHMGNFYKQGIGCDVNSVSAASHYKIAADMGNSDAQNCFGECCAAGYGTKKDDDLAISYWKKASDFHNPAGLVNLGLCYFNGIKVKQDLKKENWG